MKQEITTKCISRDVNDEGPVLTVWIALTDVKTWPLSFIKRRDRKPVPGKTPSQRSTAYNDKYEYVIVPNMEQGDMLIFEATAVAHGSPNIYGIKGKREEMSLYYTFDPNSLERSSKRQKLQEPSD